MKSLKNFSFYFNKHHTLLFFMFRWCQVHDCRWNLPGDFEYNEPDDCKRRCCWMWGNLTTSYLQRLLIRNISMQYYVIDLWVVYVEVQGLVYARC